MERARHRKTKSASGIEGIRQIQKQKYVPRLSTDSHSYIGGGNKDDMFMLEVGHSSLGGATGIPMKKLLAEEMSKDIEAKRRSPSIIAKLMGLEGLPSPRHVQRQQKRLPDSYKVKNVSVNIQRNNQLYDGRSIRKCSMEQQEFKDVYVDLEASHVANRCCSSRWNANSILMKPEMSLIQQKFIDAKHLFIDEKLQDSKELDETLDMLDSNRDLLLKFLGQQDSLFVKHLHDLKVDPSSSRIAVLKPLKSENYESNGKAWRSEKDASSKPHVASHLKREDGLLLEPHSRHRSHISRTSSRIQVEEKAEENMLPTRIVVLKPNLGKLQNGGTSCSSPDLSHAHLYSIKKIKEFPSVGGVETVSRRSKSSSHNAGFPKTMSKEAREIAKEITMRMREGYNDNMDAKSPRYRGYAGDESSYDANETDSESECEVSRLYSRRSFDDSNLCRYASSCLGESPVNKEAKKRLSERWKMTHKYQDLEMVSGCGTLGEMLALPDKVTMPNDVRAKTSLCRVSNRIDSNKGTAVLDGPLGISSRHGWKDEICGNSSRSRSVPPIDGSGRSHRRSSYQDRLAAENNLMYSDSLRRGRSKASKGNISDKEDCLPKDLKSRSKNPHSCKQIFTKERDSLSEANIGIPVELNTKDFSEQQSTLPMPQIPVVDVTMISQPGSTNMPSKSSDMFQTQSPLPEDCDGPAAQKQEISRLQELHIGPPTQGSPSQCVGVELDSSESCKEADHPSPISVLEVPFTEDTPSSSESFERVSAELQELRMQLQLLKMESGTYAESSTLLPIEEEEAQLTPIVSENYSFGDENWKTSYALDVLAHSGIEESNFDMFRTTWNSTSCPLDPHLFDKLEKKYDDQTSALKLERRLLFNLINSALVKIIEDRADLCPWVMPKLARLKEKWHEEDLLDALGKLIGQDFVNREISERVLDGEMLWPDSRGEIEIIGNEIERLLIDDMITEVVCS